MSQQNYEPIKQQQQGQYVQQQQQGQHVQQGQVVGVVPQTAQWMTGFCDWYTDITSCLDAYLCCWCQNARQYNVMKTGSNDIDVGVCLGACCVDWCCGGIGTPILSYMNRDAVRTRFGIEGGGCEDCCAALFCQICVISR